MTTLSQAIASLPQAHRAPGPLKAAIYRLRRSRSIASMLPSLLSSGVITLAMTAVMHLTWGGWTRGFVNAWMESWLTTWPIAFPMVYLLGPAVRKLAAYICAAARRTDARTANLACRDITAVSDRVTANHGLTVLRNIRPAHDFGAV